MNRLPPLSPQEVVYPTGDGQPMAETGIHVLLMISLIAMLREHFRSRQDVYVIGNIFLYYQEGRPDLRRSPDVMVVKGVDPGPERDSFKVWEERAVPSVVFELTSAGTADEDLGPKMELYQNLGVREYFLFDPMGEYLPRPLMGYRLISVAENGDDVAHEHYEELPPARDGSLPSAELGLRLRGDGTQLRLIDPRTQRSLPTPSEAYMQREEHRLQAEEARRERQLAERQAEQDRLAREQAERQAEQDRLAREQAERQAEEADHRAEQAERQAEQDRQAREQADRQAEEADHRAEQDRLARQEAERQAEQDRLTCRRLDAELARLRALLPPEAPDGGEDTP